MTPLLFRNCVLALCISWGNYALADWAELGASVKCEARGKGFTILPTIELSSEDPAAIPIEPGFRQLPARSNIINCTVGDAKVGAKINVFGPAASGECMGAGYVSIEYLRIESGSVFQHPRAFNWNCSDRILTKVRVFVRDGKHVIETCDAKDWNWGVGFSDVRCQEQNVRR